jgi:hypothetical protein
VAKEVNPGDRASAEWQTKIIPDVREVVGQGPTFVRSWLVESAWVGIRKDPVLREKFEAVWRNSGSKKKAIVAVARKLAIRLRSCILLNQEYQIGLIA